MTLRNLKLGRARADIRVRRHRADFIVAAVIILIAGYRPFPPSVFGKFTTAVQIVLVFAVVLAAAFPGLQLDLLIRVLIYLVTALTVISGFHYSITIARRLSSPAPSS